jgi:hypothetical protein
LRNASFGYLETRSLNQYPLDNTFGVIRLHCCSNNKLNVGQFIDALKTSIIIGLAYTGLRNENCESDDTELLDDLHFLLNESSASRPNPSTSHGREAIREGLCGSRITEQVQQEVNDVDMEILSVAYLSGFIARHVLYTVRCDDCKACLTSSAMLSTNAFTYFKEYKNDEQSLTYPSERLVETVHSFVTELEIMMAEVSHTYSVEGKIKAAIKNTIDFFAFSLLVVRLPTKE